MDTVVKTLWNVKQQSLLKPKILPYRMNRNCAKQTSKLITMKLSSLYIIAFIKVKAYRAPAAPVGPHSFPPDRRQWRLYRNTLRCRPTAAPRFAGQPLSATRNTVMYKFHLFQTELWTSVLLYIYLSLFHMTENNKHLKAAQNILQKKRQNQHFWNNNSKNIRCLSRHLMPHMDPEK